MNLSHDGQFTYLCSDDSKMTKLNESCDLLEQIQINRNYHTLCYDFVNCCFYAASTDNPGILFCLSDKFSEIRQITLQLLEKEAARVEYLFYDRTENQLYFTIGNKIYRTDETGSSKMISEIKGDGEKLAGICVYLQYVIYLSCQQDGQHLIISTREDGRILENEKLPVDFEAVSMVLIHDSSNPLSLNLRLLAHTNDAKYFLVDYSPDFGFFRQYTLPEPFNSPENESLPDVTMQQLNGCRLPNPFMNTRPSNNFSTSQCRQPFSPESCQTQSGSQCSPPCFPPPGLHGSSCKQHDCRQSCADVIESIALTEASIAHVLNAEGEKLQKAIACTSSISELLKINDSVLKTIIHSTHLEQMLYYKLETVLSSDCCANCKAHCCTDNHCHRTNCSNSNCNTTNCNNTNCSNKNCVSTNCANTHTE